MKLFEHNQGGGNNTECGSWYYDKKVCEFNNKIYIRQQGHIKTDLKPIFNDYFGMSAYGEAMSLHNKIGMDITQHAPPWCTKVKIEIILGIMIHITECIIYIVLMVKLKLVRY